MIDTINYPRYFEDKMCWIILTKFFIKKVMEKSKISFTAPNSKSSILISKIHHLTNKKNYEYLIKTDQKVFGQKKKLYKQNPRKSKEFPYQHAWRDGEFQQLPIC